MKEALARGFVFGFGFYLGAAVATAVVHQIEWHAKAELAESLAEGIHEMDASAARSKRANSN
jgi:hypothetical protein